LSAALAGKDQVIAAKDAAIAAKDKIIIEALTEALAAKNQVIAAQIQVITAKDKELERLGAARERAAKRVKAAEDTAVRSYAELGGVHRKVKQVCALLLNILRPHVQLPAVS
jgi:hypothetical protein